MSQKRVRYFELRQKFWEITLNGRELTVRYGAIESNGLKRSRMFSSADEAKKAANALMLHKHGKGYVYLEEKPPDDHGDYWGGVEQDFGGFRSARAFHIPRFERTTKVGLGQEDDGFTELHEPSAAELAELASVFQKFLNTIDAHYAAVHGAALEEYRKVYARYYEDEKKSGAPPRGIGTLEDHARHVRLDGVRVQEGRTIRLIFDYEFDQEHGLEVVIRGNTFWGIGGISDVIR